MGHLIKYRFLQVSREKTIMFWALLFPIILGTFFRITFGGGDMGENMEKIPVAVVKEADSSDSAEAFSKFLEEMDEDVVKLYKVDEKEALKRLKADEVLGIYYVKEEPSLTVAKSGIEPSILNTLMDTYNKNAAMMKEIAQKHPEGLEQAVAAMQDWEKATEEVSVAGRTLDPNISYFFALLAYACLSGAFLGVKATLDGQANLSPLGARRSVTPTHKMKLVLTDMAVFFSIHFANILILTLYIKYVLGIDLGENMAGILLINLLGSMIGVSAGMLLGCISRVSADVKMGLCVLLTLFPGFLAGLMFGGMKNVIERNCPIINRINPAAVLSDAYYCLGVYNDPVRFARSLTILGGMSAACILISFLLIRRERYDSI